ncbi:uncharacterized protein LOC142980022 isoform X4 [Anticarsia gemmatalis]|uniref:uncharacterized protein LOC142980022 isoform X4 n=1 Tax=Anticarsia gemmatalis TaxID=129554 RepID=UPI003F76B0E6
MGRKKRNTVYRFFELNVNNLSSKCLINDCGKILKTRPQFDFWQNYPECPVLGVAEPTASDDDPEQQQKRLQLINFGHTQWGFNNWSWAVTKQEVDFVDFTNGKYCAGVVAFVNITVKSFDIHRENIGYATSVATSKGFAVYKSRKCAVTNALRETLLSFGGSVATELTELLESTRSEISPANLPPEPPAIENNQNVANRPAAEPKNSPHNRPVRKDSVDVPPPNALRSPLVPPQPPQPPQQPQPPPAVKNAPTSKPLPLGPLPPGPPANRAALAGTGRPAPAPAPGAARPNSNEPVKTAAEVSEEEARAERKRRQRQAQEEFRLKQLMKQNTEEKQELSRNSSSFDKLLLDIPTQDIVIESTGEDATKRKSPGPDGGVAKRRTGCVSKLDIVKDQ